MVASRKEIIKHMLPWVSTDGWSEYSLQEAAAETGVSAADIKLLFPEGVKDCMVVFLSEEDRALAEMITPEALVGLSLPEKMEKIIMTRLQSWLPEREIIRGIVSFNSLPWNHTWGLKTLFNSVDRMWRIAGDVSSTSASLYKKRMTLVGVYNATLAFWADDKSPDLVATAMFLRRQLYSEVAALGYFNVEAPAEKIHHGQSNVLPFKTKV